MRRTKSLGEFIPEIERYLHKKKREAQNDIVVSEHTLKEYATPSTEEPYAIIVYPTVEGNNFEIKPALLNLVQQNQISGSPVEDPNLHISTFLRLSGTLKANQEARFKEMLRLCPHHGLEKWLIVHTFYNGLSYTTKMTVDAAAGGALMNKNYTEAYALIEDMTQNHYQWTNERAITTSLPSKKEAGMYEVSNYDHLAAKLGSAANGVEQMNYAQYNMGTRPNQNFYKNPHGSYGQVAPLGYANNQRVAQKSSLEILKESYVMNQSKQLQEHKNQTGFLNDSLSKLNTKLEETIAKAKGIKGESVKLLGENDVIESEKPLDKTKAHSPLRLAKLNLEVQFNKFVNILKKICIKIPFAEALSRMPLYAKFIKEIFSKKNIIEHNETIALTGESSVMIKKPPPKLRDSGSFLSLA
ncbi:transposable element protein, putative [Medicago truncatula]|uniref:Transposable element protein, putative n=1 Tax=Medicago truncatula TaxID=3880 RepID=A0A072TEJ9_MEDTR|nr:transposable element protein, putative [Medicago truncatula]